MRFGEFSLHGLRHDLSSLWASHAGKGLISTFWVGSLKESLTRCKGIDDQRMGLEDCRISHGEFLEKLKWLDTAEQSRDSHAISHVIRLVQSAFFFLRWHRVRHKGVDEGGVIVRPRLRLATACWPPCSSTWRTTIGVLLSRAMSMTAESDGDSIRFDSRCRPQSVSQSGFFARLCSEVAALHHGAAMRSMTCRRHQGILVKWLSSGINGKARQSNSSAIRLRINLYGRISGGKCRFLS